MWSNLPKKTNISLYILGDGIPNDGDAPEEEEMDGQELDGQEMMNEWWKISNRNRYSNIFIIIFFQMNSSSKNLYKVTQYTHNTY